MGEEEDGPVPHLAWRVAAGQPPPLRRFAGEENNGLAPHPAWRVRLSASSPPQIRLVCFNFVRGRDRGEREANLCRFEKRGLNK